MSTLLRTAFQFDMERLWPGMNRNSPDLERVFHIHRASWKRLAERVLSTKFLFSLLNIYFRLIGYQSSCLIIHFLYGSNCHDNSGTETCLIIWRSTFIHFQDRRGAASPRFFHRFYLWTKAQFDMDFFPRRKSFLVHCKHSLSTTWLKTPSRRRRTSCLFLIIDHFHPDYNALCLPPKFYIIFLLYIISPEYYSRSKRNPRQWLRTTCTMVLVKMLNGRGVDLWTPENKST